MASSFVVYPLHYGLPGLSFTFTYLQIIFKENSYIHIHNRDFSVWMGRNPNSTFGLDPRVINRLKQTRIDELGQKCIYRIGQLDCLHQFLFPPAQKRPSRCGPK
jgi:hypothetical protein